MEEREKNRLSEMTNEEYREQLRIIFESINENYKLEWFYGLVVEKLRSSN